MKKQEIHIIINIGTLDYIFLYIYNILTNFINAI